MAQTAGESKRQGDGVNRLTAAILSRFAGLSGPPGTPLKHRVEKAGPCPTAPGETKAPQAAPCRAFDLVPPSGLWSHKTDQPKRSGFMGLFLRTTFVCTFLALPVLADPAADRKLLADTV